MIFKRSIKESNYNHLRNLVHLKLDSKAILILNFFRREKLRLIVILREDFSVLK